MPSLEAALDVDARVLTDATPHVADPQPKAAVRDTPARKGRILRYVADRRPVTFTFAMLALHFVAFFLAPTGWAVALVLPFALASMFISPLNHHHQHFNTFHSTLLNRIYEVALSLQTGISPYAWVLHHNLGHHRNYLNQPPHDQPDESRWTRDDGSTMGRVEYTIHLVLNHQLDIYRVGQRHPRHWRAYLLMKIPIYAILALLFVLNPINAFLIFVLPGFVALVHTSWATYEHHAGHHPTSHDDASVNRTDPVYNFLTCNLGYHTAHHMRPGVHWSLLPRIHADIEHRIPEEMILRTFW